MFRAARLLAHSCAYRLIAGLSFNGWAECRARSRLCSSKTVCSKDDDDDDDGEVADGVAFAVGQKVDFWGGSTWAADGRVFLVQVTFWQFWKFSKFWKFDDDDEEKHELLDCVTVVTVRWPPHPCL